MCPPVCLLVLNWSLDRPYVEIHRICSDRILTRGANHQTLHGDTTNKSHEDVVWMFLRSAEPLNEYETDATIEMDIGEDLEHSLTRAIDGIVRELGPPRPDPERVGAALSMSEQHSPKCVGTSLLIRRALRSRRPRRNLHLANERLYTRMTTTKIKRVLPPHTRRKTEWAASSLPSPRLTLYSCANLAL